VANDGEFQEQVRQLGKLIAEFDQLPDSAAKVAGKELVQLLMDVHGAGLERMMEIVFDSGSLEPGNAGSASAGAVIIDKLGQDSVAGSLLLLYSLHPDDLETRVQRAVERLRPRVRKLGCAIELADVREGAVQLRLAVSSHSCGSSSKDLRLLVEDGVYEFAPDVGSLEILGLEEPTGTGFVPLERLLGNRLVAAASTAQPVERESGD
jgi:Fe-S cluster biogenesis protein NfuA